MKSMFNKALLVALSMSVVSSAFAMDDSDYISHREIISENMSPVRLSSSWYSKIADKAIALASAGYEMTKNTASSVLDKASVYAGNARSLATAYLNHYGAQLKGVCTAANLKKLGLVGGVLGAAYLVYRASKESDENKQDNLKFAAMSAGVVGITALAAIAREAYLLRSSLSSMPIVLK